MADSISQIMQQLDSYYAPSVQATQSQLDALPAQTAAQQDGLDQAKTNAFSDITAGANSRGVLYSGIPIGEQAKYVGATYLPAVANLQQSQATRTANLQDSIAKIRQQQSTQAYGIRNSQLTQEAAAAAAQQKNAIAAQKAASSGSSSGGSTKATKPAAQDIVNYYVSAPSQYGAYNPHSTNNHRYQAAAQDLQAAGYDISHGSTIDKLLQRTFNPH